MRQFDISARPLLDQDRKQSGSKAKHKAQCPHGVDTDDVGGRRMVARIGGQLLIAFNESGDNSSGEYNGLPTSLLR